MIRALIVVLFGCILGIGLGIDARFKRQEKDTQRIATEAACRTIVEAGLVRSCTLRK